MKMIIKKKNERYSDLRKRGKHKETIMRSHSMKVVTLQ